MPFFSLIGVSQENAEAGKQYNFLKKEGYTQCYNYEGLQSKDKESRERPSNR